MRRTFLAKIGVLLGAAVAALLLTIYQPAPQSLIPFGVGQAEVRAAPGGRPDLKSAYRLDQLKIINLTLQKIHDNYVDPTRIDSAAMLLAMLESIQRNVAEVMVEPADDKKSVTLQVNDKRSKFDIADVGSPWRLHAKMKEILRFIQANMNPSSDPAQIEYAAVNGLLGTLDPHSLLLDPEAAREMDINTSGKFGGIGIVIGMRKGKLTVIQLIDKNTPAAKAGLKNNDHIAQINDEPTTNMTLSEAMNRLRGDPNTKVELMVARKGEDKERRVSITRDVIQVSSVEGRLLSMNVGYLKVKSFSSRTFADLRSQLIDLRKKGAKTWVLDLRWNPGGLLDQAIKVTDMFVSSGTIVTTVGFAGKQRDEKRASQSDTLAGNDPMVVLVNAGSASASEIVAGALKNLNRAVVVGETSFGKGSVQILFSNDDGSKLKLTIAQYLTPGDVSIQSVGVPPDIEILPAFVPESVKDAKDVVRLRGQSNRFTREKDLDAHLTSKNARAAQVPQESLRYLYVPPKSQKNTAATADEDDDAASLDEEPITDPDTFEEDFPIRFSKELVAQAGAVTRSETLKRADKFLKRIRAEQEASITAALGKIKIDWNLAPRTGEAKLEASFVTDKADNKVAAGDVIAITGTVKNTGTGPAFRVRAYFKTDDYLFDEEELVFGRIDAGKSVSFTTYIKLPKSAITRLDRVEPVFEEAYGAKTEAKPVKIVVEGLPRPQFAYAYQVIDTEGGNGDGLVQPGEKIKLLVTVRNQGPGKSHDTQAVLRNASGDAVVVYKGRYELAEIAPGAERQLEFTFDVRKKVDMEELMLELSVYDSAVHEGVNEKLKFRLRPASAGPTAADGSVQVSAGSADVHEGAAANSKRVGRAKKGTAFKLTGVQGEWFRVDLGNGRPGFVAAAHATRSTKKPGANAFVADWQVTPPKVTVELPSLETRGKTWTLKGMAQDESHVEDVYVLVSNRDAKIEGKKVYYQSNRGQKAETRMGFQASIPVWPGNNAITVVARENNDVLTAHTFYVHRTDDATMVQATPATTPTAQ